MIGKLSRIMDADEAAALIGTRADDLDPTPELSNGGRWVDDDTGQPLLAIFPCPDLARLRRTLLQIPAAAYHNVYRSGSGNRNTSVTFGYRPRKPMMGGQEGCVLTAFNRDHPEAAAYLAWYSDALAEILTAAFPTVVGDARKALAEVLPDWRLTPESPWTSGVINLDSPLPYHRDGNNFDAWSVMPVVRMGMRGGHLHIPEYGIVVPCRDGQVVAFYGKQLVHGVTPVRRARPDAYRYSVVFYALRGLKDCRTFADETVYAARRRTAREDEMGEGKPL